MNYPTNVLLAEEKTAAKEDKKYLPFVSFYSLDDTDDVETKVARLFDDTPEQISHGTASWDQLGWSRDGWVI